jgi:integrase
LPTHPLHLVRCPAERRGERTCRHAQARSGFINQPGLHHGEVVAGHLTRKNKTLLSQLESEKLRAKLIFLPEKLVESVVADLKYDRVRFVQAQIAIAVAILLSVPLRSHNLSALEWRHHFSEPDGPKGRLIVHIGAKETKTGKSDYVAEVPAETAGLIRWYRATILPRLKTDPNGYLFVTRTGKLKSQETLSQQIVEALADHVGVHMTPHQFRHFAAVLYLEDRPDDFETVRNLLGPAWGKTTSIYAGSGSRRASRAYGTVLIEQREALRTQTIGRTLRRGRFKEQSVDEHS